ncbi:MAG: glycoside hydrolase family 127 protein [Victivallales bacterium]|nr:glycoside hydrolase family 127 protein [Victivallales bacterium]
MEIHLKDTFFAPRQAMNIAVTIPSAIKRCEETGRIDAFKLQWKPGCTLPQPHVFWDSDVAKVMEGMAYTAASSPEITQRLDKLVDLVISAQQEDGYLNTHYIVTETDKRWCELFYKHELYCAGHLTEAAVAHYNATGDKKFLNAMRRYCDYICDVFGPDGKQGYPGHEEIELALVKLYKATGDEKYLRQAKLFIDRRGTSPNYFVAEEKQPEIVLPLFQAHKPVREQTKAVGHAVRALYLYSGMADVAEATGDTELLAACERLFDDLAQNKMFITGGVGSRQIGECIGGAGEQVSERSYAESCAAMALVLFTSRMLKITGKSKYADVMERALYNCVMSGLSLSGDRFFYANLHACHRGMECQGHVATERQKWYDCSCCPTSYCRFLPQIGNFCFRAEADYLAIDIPAAASVKGDNYEVEIASNYPYSGKVSVRVVRGGNFELKVRIPGWCGKYTLPNEGETKDSYWTLKKHFADGESFDFDFAMPVETIFTSIPSLASQAALCRGPLVYCVELPLTSEISPFELILTPESTFETFPMDDLVPGCVGIRFTAKRLHRPDALYSTHYERLTDTSAVAIPYSFWQNREKSEMTIFMPFYHQ